MAEKDFTQKSLETYNDVFADIVNVLLFQGKYIVDEKKLKTETSRSVYKFNQELHEEERDVCKFWKNSHFRIALFGFENQTTKDNNMPLRIMGYDGAAYKGQVLMADSIRNRKNRKDTNDRTDEKDRTGGTDGKCGTEDSRAFKEPRLYPVISLVLYFGTKRWRRPLSLKDRIEVPDHLAPYFNDYRINLFEIAWLTDEQVAMFQSDFRYVADFFVQKRKDKQYEVPEGNVVHADALLKLMSALTGNDEFEVIANKHAKKKVKVSSMKEIWDQFKDMGREEGRSEGRSQGRSETLLQSIRDLMESLQCTANRALELLKIPPEEQGEFLRHL